MTDKIQFACSHCGSTLAVPAEYAGKKAKCPVCGSPITVPATGTGGNEAFAAAAPASDTPWSSAAIGSQEMPSSVTPNESPFGEHDSFGAASGKPLSAATPPRERSPFGDLAPGEGGSASPTDPPRATSVGRSIAGLAAAMGIGLAAMIVWLVLAAMSGYELGILAWGIGALIGTVAGVIARNPSPAFCAIVAVVAMGAILSAKLVMTLAIMAAHFFSTQMDEFVLPPVYDKYSHAYVDQVLADNYFVGDQKRFAIELNADYFEPQDAEDLEAQEEGEAAKTLTEVQQEMEDQLRREFYRLVRQRVDNATDEEKAIWLANAHERHPAWIEEYSHYQIAVMELVASPDQLDPELTAHAQYVLSYLSDVESENDAEYSDNITPAEFNRRDRQLRLKCAEYLRGKSAADIDALLRKALRKCPNFNPFPEAFTATLDKMLTDGKLNPELQAHATLFINTETGPDEEMAYYDAPRTPEFVATDTAMRQAVNERLANMDEAARLAAITATKALHPSWYAGEEEVILPDVAEAKRELGDGTFVGTLKMVFGVYDLLWLFLGATTAYGTAMRRGRKA